LGNIRQVYNILSKKTFTFERSKKKLRSLFFVGFIYGGALSVDETPFTVLFNPSVSTPPNRWGYELVP